jgi:hypothetical protein
VARFFKALWFSANAANLAVWLWSLAGGGVTVAAAVALGVFSGFPAVMQFLLAIVVFAVATVAIVEVVVYIRRPRRPTTETQPRERVGIDLEDSEAEIEGLSVKDQDTAIRAKRSRLGGEDWKIED